MIPTTVICYSKKQTHREFELSVGLRLLKNTYGRLTLIIQNIDA